MSTVKVIKLNTGEGIAALMAMLESLQNGTDPEAHKKFLESPMLPGMTLTNGEVNALFSITESWDQVRNFLVSVDWEKTIALMVKFAQPENHPAELSDKVPPVEFIERRITEARALQVASTVLKELAATCQCEDCVAERKRDEVRKAASKGA
jgi:hypothetical protein